MKHFIILLYCLVGSLSAQKKFTVEVPKGVNFKAETIVSEGTKISAEVYTPSNAGAKSCPPYS